MERAMKARPAATPAICLLLKLLSSSKRDDRHKQSCDQSSADGEFKYPSIGRIQLEKHGSDDYAEQSQGDSSVKDLSEPYCQNREDNGSDDQNDTEGIN